MSENGTKTTALGMLAQELVDEMVKRGVSQAQTPRAQRLLTTEAAAQYLSVDTETVKRLRAAGKLRSVGLLERKLLFDIDDLDRVIEDLKEQ